MTPERALKAKIRKHLLSLGAYVYAPVPNGMGGACLDIIACVPVVSIRDAISEMIMPRTAFISIEVKTPGNKPTARQMATIDSIKSAGGIAFWCDSIERYLAVMATYGLV